MHLLHPTYFLLLLLVPLIWFFPRRVTDVRHGLLRTIVLSLIVCALARPVLLTESGIEHHVLVHDLSASVTAPNPGIVSARLAQIEEELGSSGMITRIEMGVARSEAPKRNESSDPLRLVSIPTKTTAADGHTASGSPLSDALAAAATRIPDGALGSVTLVSDGLATDRRWAPVVQGMTERGLPVHTVATSHGATGDVAPVRLFARETLRVGATARIFVQIVGHADDLRITLTGPGETRVELEGIACRERVTVPLPFEPKEAGFVSLQVEVRSASGSGDDPANNQMSRTFAVQEAVRVLYLGERLEGGAEKLGELVGPGFQLDDGAEEGGPPLRTYDLVVLDDRPAERLPAGFQKQLIDAVQTQGLGLLAAGGRASFAGGGYHETPLEDVLPVELVQKEEKKDPSTALAVIIDTSGSMAGNRIRLAKEVARLAIRRLLPHDKVGIVEFYGAKRWAAPLQSAANAIDIQRALNRLDAGGGTVLLPAVEEAYYGLKNVQTRYKHVLLLTDAGVETGPYENLLRRMSRDGICVSTVLVGPGRHAEFLVQLSDWGNGRYYNAADRFNLPEVLLKQPSTARLPAYRAGSHAVESPGAERGWAESWWGPVAATGVPTLAGYVETRRRPGAEIVLQTSRESHPVLASWRFGLGRVTAFVTEPTGPGTESWRDWAGYGPFLARVLERTASDIRVPFRYRLTRSDYTLQLEAVRTERSQARPLARRSAALGEGSDESQSVPVTFRERANGAFTAEWVADPASEQRVFAGVDDGQRRTEVRLVSNAWDDVSPERNVDPAEALDLAALSRATGGQHLSVAGLDRFLPAAGGGTRPLGIASLWPWLLALALLCYLGEIAYRRSEFATGKDAT